MIHRVKVCPACGKQPEQWSLAFKPWGDMIRYYAVCGLCEYPQWIRVNKVRTGQLPPLPYVPKPSPSVQNVSQSAD